MLTLDAHLYHLISIKQLTSPICIYLMQKRKADKTHKLTDTIPSHTAVWLVL